MKKSKTYIGVYFAADVLKKALKVFNERLLPESDKEPTLFLTVEVGGEEWQHDSLEEFFADYRRQPTSAHLLKELGPAEFSVCFIGNQVLVKVGGEDRSHINAVFEVFESHLEESRLQVGTEVTPQKPCVFIGHGRSTAWRDLKDHLQDKHGYRIVAYESGARAGHVIRDVLEEMLSSTSFALLVMTAEDETATGEMRARQNVIHEVGLFQGRLGFIRAIVLLEEGAEEFSNIRGIEQIRFSPGNIKETYGEVLAILRREFEDDAT